MESHKSLSNLESTTSCWKTSYRKPVIFSYACE